MLHRHWACTNCLTSCNLTLRLIDAPWGTCQPPHPFPGRASGRCGGIEKAVVSFMHVNGPRETSLTSFGHLFHFLQLIYPPLHVLYMSLVTDLSLFVCFPSLSFLLSAVLSSAHISCRLWCVHSWSWRSRPGNVGFTDTTPPMTRWFAFPSIFQKAEILTVQGTLRFDSACLIAVEKPLKKRPVLIDWGNVSHGT